MSDKAHPAEWEYDFHNPPRHRPPVRCQYTGEEINPDQALRRTFWNGRRWETYHFVDQQALEDWYINQLRTLGL